MSDYKYTSYAYYAYGYSYINDDYGSSNDYGSPGYRYGNGVLQENVIEYGPGQYGPHGGAQYYGGQSVLGYAYYVLNTDGTTTYFQGGPGGPGGPYIPYGDYGTYYNNYGEPYSYGGCYYSGPYYGG